MTLVSFLMVGIMLAALGQSYRILVFKKHGGELLAVLGLTPKNGFNLGVALLALVYVLKIYLGKADDASSLDHASLFIYYCCLFSMIILGILGGVDRLKIREKGLSNGNLMVFWSDINSYHWNGHNLTLDHRNLFFQHWKTRLRLKPDQFALLKPYLPG